MKSIYVKKLIFPQEPKEALLKQLQSAVFSSEAGEGIRIVDLSKNCISCHFLYEQVYSQNTYNIETGEFDKIEFKRVDCTPFFIDLDRYTLDIVGSKQQAMRVIEFFGRTTRYKIGIEDAQISLLRLLESCIQSNIAFTISRVKISDYTFFDNIIGDCTLNLFDYPKAIDIVKKFEHQITNVTISITLEDTYSIVFYKNGSIAIYKDADGIDIEVIRLLKQGL